MRVALYARVSSPSQAEHLAPQLERLRHFARARWPAAELLEFREVESGAHLRRPGLAEVLALVHKKRVDALIVEHLDRLSRSLADGIQLIDQVQQAGAALVVLEQPIDTSTPAGRAGAHLLQVIAQWQREDLRDRTRKGIAAAQARGVHCGRPRLVAELDLDSIRERRSMGASLGAIAAELGLSRDTLRRRIEDARGLPPGARRDRHEADGRGDPRARPRRTHELRGAADGGGSAPRVRHRRA